MCRKSLFGNGWLIDLREVKLLVEQRKCRLSYDKVIADGASELIALLALVKDRITSFRNLLHLQLVAIPSNRRMLARNAFIPSHRPRLTGSPNRCWGTIVGQCPSPAVLRSSSLSYQVWHFELTSGSLGKSESTTIVEQLSYCQYHSAKQARCGKTRRRYFESSWLKR